MLIHATQLQGHIMSGRLTCKAGRRSVGPVNPDEALTVVHRARVRDEQAREHATQTRRVLQEAAIAAVAAGAVKAQVALAAGVSRDSLYQWLAEPAQKEAPA